MTRRGVSLIEMVLAAGLAGLLFLVAGSTVVVIQRQSQRGQLRVQFNQCALLIQTSLSADLRSSALSAVERQLGEDEIRLAIQPLKSVDASGAQIWSDIWTCYRWTAAGQKLERWQARRTLTQTSSPTRLTPGDFAAMLTHPEPLQGVRKLADHLQFLHLEFTPGGAVRYDGLFQGEGERPVSLSWSRIVYLRNSPL